MKRLGLFAWQDLLSTLREEVAVVGPDYTTLYANSPFLERLGLHASQVIGQSWYQVIHIEDTPGHTGDEECPVRRAMQTGRPASAIYPHTRDMGYR
ncbi:MAG: PAS domain-containing protein, partial [Dehalococcoidia bacterium]|nr:PAS domain-containing protein [Dehalococcoidia bacterium]